MPEVQAIAELQNVVKTLENLLERVRKSGLTRRTRSTVENFETERADLWNRITLLHNAIATANPPPPGEYKDIVKKFQDVNKKIIMKLREYSKGDDGGVTTSFPYNETAPSTPFIELYEGYTVSEQVEINARNDVPPAPVVTSQNLADALQAAAPSSYAAARNQTSTPQTAATNFNTPGNSAINNFAPQSSAITTQQIAPVTYTTQSIMTPSNSITSGRIDNENQNAQTTNKGAIPKIVQVPMGPTGVPTNVTGIPIFNTNWNHQAQLGAVNINVPNTNTGQFNVNGQYYASNAIPQNMMNGMTPNYYGGANNFASPGQGVNLSPINTVYMPMPNYGIPNNNAFLDFRQKVEKFNGKATEFEPFKLKFINHLRNTHYDEKFKYEILKNHLADTPLNFAQQQRQNQVDPFEATVRMLESKYNNEKIVLATSFDELALTIEPITRAGDAVSLQKAWTTYNNCMVNLMNKGLTIDHLFSHLFKLSLDEKTRSRLEDFDGHSQRYENEPKAPTSEIIHKFVEKELEVFGGLNVTEKRRMNEKFKSNVNNKPQQFNKPRSSTTNNYTAQDQELSCYFCDENHEALKCPKFLAAKNRVNLCKTKKVCIYCVRHKWRRNSPCKANLECDQCDKNHVPEMHEDIVSSFVATTAHEEVRITPTIVAEAEAIDGSTQVIRALLDTGAESSFITTAAVKALGLELKSMNPIKVNGISGGNQLRCNQYVNLTLRTSYRHKTVKVKAYVISKVTAPLPSSTVKAEACNKFQLADTKWNQKSEISLLLGVDCLKQTMIDKSQVRIIDELVYLPTVFGYVIFGSKEGNKTNQTNSLMVQCKSLKNKMYRRRKEKRLMELLKKPITAKAVDRRIKKHLKSLSRHLPREQKKQEESTLEMDTSDEEIKAEEAIVQAHKAEAENNETESSAGEPMEPKDEIIEILDSEEEQAKATSTGAISEEVKEKKETTLGLALKKIRALIQAEASANNEAVEAPSKVNNQEIGEPEPNQEIGEPEPMNWDDQDTEAIEDEAHLQREENNQQIEEPREEQWAPIRPPTPHEFRRPIEFDQEMDMARIRNAPELENMHEMLINENRVFISFERHVHEREEYARNVQDNMRREIRQDLFQQIHDEVRNGIDLLDEDHNLVRHIRLPGWEREFRMSIPDSDYYSGSEEEIAEEEIIQYDEGPQDYPQFEIIRDNQLPGHIEEHVVHAMMVRTEPINQMEEEEKLYSFSSEESKEQGEPLIKKKLSWNSAIRVIAFIMRWRNSDKKVAKKEKVDKPLNYKKHSPFSSSEYNRARMILIRAEQKRVLEKEIQQITKGKLVSKQHWLYRMCPVIDENQVLRVGGRLGNAPITEDQKHQIILPKTELAEKLIAHMHKTSLHAGESKALQMTIPEYYIPGIKSGVHKAKLNCMACKRYNAKIIQPQMGHLPRVRVEPAALFHKVGVDLGKTVKAWISVFACVIVWLSMVSLANCLSIKQLEPGVHLYNKGNVFLKATDIKLNINTNLNLTENTAIIEAAMDKLNSECEKNKAYRNVYDYCSNLLLTLNSTKNMAITHIVRSYQKREKRAIVPLIVQGARKYGTTVALGTIMAYGTYEIAVESHKNKAARAKIELTEKTLRENTEMLFNVQIGEKEDLDSKMEELITQQQLKNLESSFIANFMAIDSLIKQTVNAHDEIQNIQPREEIVKLQEKYAVPLPQITQIAPTELLKRAKRSKEMENGRVTVKLTIPLETEIQYTKWIVVNVPDNNQTVVSLNEMKEDTLIESLVIDETNTTGFKPTEESAPSFYENVNITAISPCLAAIMKQAELETTCEKERVRIRSQSHQIGEDARILIIKENNTAILCGTDEQQLQNNRAYEIEYENCSIKQGEVIWLSRTNMTESSDNPIIPIMSVPIRKLAVHNSTSDLRKLKERTLQQMDSNWQAIQRYTEAPTLWTLVTSPIIIVVAVICYFIYKKRNNQRRDDIWLPNWNGPVITIQQAPTELVY